MKKKCKVVSLPTKDKKNGIILNTPNSIYRNDLFHLYVVSDEDVQEGDYVYNGKYGFKELEPEICKWSYDDWIESPDFEDMKVYKVIATTDEQLCLPLISEQFVKEYCDANGIEEIMCELEERFADNYVSISPIKESWSREEVEALCRKAYKEGQKERVFYEKCVKGYVFPSKNMKAFKEDEFINNSL